MAWWLSGAADNGPVGHSPPGSTHGFTGRQAFLVVSALQDSRILLPPGVLPSCQLAIHVADEVRGGVVSTKRRQRDAEFFRCGLLKLALTGIVD